MCGILSLLPKAVSPVLKQRGYILPHSERLLSLLEDVRFIQGFGCLGASKESGLCSWLYFSLRLSIPSRDMHDKGLGTRPLPWTLALSSLFFNIPPSIFVTTCNPSQSPVPNDLSWVHAFLRWPELIFWRASLGCSSQNFSFASITFPIFLLPLYMMG